MGVSVRTWRRLVISVAAGVLLALPAGVAWSGPTAWARPLSQGPSSTEVSRQQVIDLVNLTHAALKKNTPRTLTAINAGQKPYVDPALPQLYAFVYDTDVTLVATPDPSVRGQNMSGRPDVVGHYFRDQIVAGALENKSGWVAYVYKEPGKDGLYQKQTYYRLADGTDGKQYVVCAGRYLGPYTGSIDTTTSPTQADVQVFVKKAVAYAKEHGRQAALDAFSAPGGDFHQGELYIYAYDYSGTVLAHGGDPTLVGKNLIGMTDPNGVPVIKDLVGLARNGGGWLYYTWPNPQHGGAQEPKLGYVLPVDDTWFLGSGTYGPAAQQPPTKAEVKDFVDQAYAYAKAHGRAAAIAQFSRKDGAFCRGQLYIFAYTLKGTCLCLPNQPELVGTDRWDYRDRNGVYVVRTFASVARHPGSGWVDYEYANPSQGFAIQRKSSYVRGIDGEWLIGAGTYRPE